VRSLRALLVSVFLSVLVCPVVPAQAAKPGASGTVVVRVRGCGGYSPACFAYPARVVVSDSHGHRIMSERRRDGSFRLKLVPGRYTIVAKVPGSVLPRRKRWSIDVRAHIVTHLKFVAGIGG
jgi:hypothetical protein